jgi:hypothetical protein
LANDGGYGQGSGKKADGEGDKAGTRGFFWKKKEVKMSKWVVDEGDSCPKLGAPREVLVDKDNKFDTGEGLEFPKVERCTQCDWEHQLEEDPS